MYHRFAICGVVAVREKILRHTISTKQEKLRLDKYLMGLGLGISRSQIHKLFEEGKVRSEGKPVKAHHWAKQGEEIVITYSSPQEFKVEPEEVPLDIVYEDSDVIVVNKPAGMVVHPARGNLRGTLVNALLYHCKTLAKSDDFRRPGVVHRLDKDTTGLLVFARSYKAHLGLAQQVEKRSMKRKYLAVVWGSVETKEGRIDAPIGRHTFDRKKMAVTPFASRPAFTDFKVLERFGAATYLQLTLGTGRTHQIRVHLSHLGHPLVGDPTYSGRKPALLTSLGIGSLRSLEDLLRIISRQALHAAGLGFIHPVTGEKVEFTSPLPHDMERVLEYLRRTYGDESRCHPPSHS